MGSPDHVSMCLIPFGILKAEPMPKWFTNKRVQTYQDNLHFFSRGFAGNGDDDNDKDDNDDNDDYQGLLLIYCVCGTFLSMAFIRNFSEKYF